MPGFQHPFPVEPSEEHVLSVTELTAQVKAILEGAFPSVWVAGEMSDISRPQSGHVYFTLKDAGAQVRGVMWRNTASRVRFDLEDGIEVLCRGSIDVYPPRGSYQLVVRHIEPRGEGALQKALRKLQQKLSEEGLFAPERKRPLPSFPQRIAVVTSPTGAAIRDFLEVLRRRWRGVEVLIVPVRVQGDGAAEEIVAGIQRVNQIRPAPDVLVVGRGGGSLEDLWSFNEEMVVREIVASRIPVVSAVGHEIDVTLADLAADVRALTPSEAGERVVPSTDEIIANLRTLQTRLVTALRTRAADARSRLDAIAQRRVFRKPHERLHELARRVDELELRSRQAIRRQQTAAGERLAALAGRLETLSPLAVLARGYSLTERTDDKQMIRDAAELNVGEQITTRLLRGQAISRVEEVIFSNTNVSRTDAERSSPSHS
ncbi:MAG: exodeoxyribonuclease VII large subunit [Pirellulaceae bacterium]